MSRLINVVVNLLRHIINAIYDISTSYETIDHVCFVT